MANDAYPEQFQYADYRLFFDKPNIKRHIIKKYFKESIIHIVNGGKDIIFTKNINSNEGITYIAIKSIPFTGIKDFTVKIDGASIQMSQLFYTYYHTHSYDFIDYIPYLINDTTPPKIFNIFPGFRFQFSKIENIPKLINGIIWHIQNIICCNNDNTFLYIMNWITHLFQRPQEKIGVAIVLYSNIQGVGKNRFTSLLMNILGKSLSFQTDTLPDITSKFNAYIQGKLLIVANEVENFQNHRVTNVLKSKITEPYQKIEEKGKDGYMIKDCSRYIFTTNNINPFFVESSDRRFLFLECNPLKTDDYHYFNELSNDIENDAILKLFFNYVSSRNIDNWNFGDIPITNLKKTVIRDNISCSYLSLIEYIQNYHKNTQIEYIRISSKGLYQSYVDYTKENHLETLTNIQFYRELKILGLNKKRMKINDKNINGFEINLHNLEKQLRTLLHDETFTLI